MKTLVPFLSKYRYDILLITSGLGGGCIGYMKDIKEEQNYKLFYYVFGSAVGLCIPPLIKDLALDPRFKKTPIYALPFIATYYTLKHYSKDSNRDE